jgi:dUTP pyrophosphatase
MPKFNIKKIHPDSIVPERAKFGDSGLDLFSTEAAHLEPGDITLIGTGWQMEVPLGYEIQIRSRSGLALKNGITVLNSPGTVDCFYRGEVKVILRNNSQVPFDIKKGDKIAQMVIAAVNLWKPNIVEELTETSRGDAGFGSTGV